MSLKACLLVIPIRNMAVVDGSPLDEKWSGLLPDLFRYPVSGVVAGSAIAVSIYYWSGGDIEPLVVSYRGFTTEPWRLLTSSLPHGDWIHLVFNVYWLVHFGAILESKKRRWFTGSLFAYLAAGSSAAEYAVDYGGIGLSGVGYGLFGFLWVASRVDQTFAGSIGRQTTGIFIGWFFLCILLTELDVWQIANVAHGAGAILGVLGGCAMLGPLEKRRRWRVGVAAVLFLLGWSATSGREFVNHGRGVAYENSHRAFDTMEAGDCAAAVELFQSALAIDDDEEDDWYYLGVCYQELERSEDALRALRRAHQLDLEDEDNTIALSETLRRLSEEATTQGRYDRVVGLMNELQTFASLEASEWVSLARAYRFLGRHAEADAAFAEALRLDPENEERYRREVNETQ